MDEKTIKKLEAAGLIKEKYRDYEKIYAQFEVELKAAGSKMEAYYKTSEIMGFSEVTIQRAVKIIGSL